MTDTNLLIDKILLIQQDRTKNIEENNQASKTKLQQKNLSELQNTVALTTITNKIQTLEYKNQILQQKINKKSNFSKSIQNTYSRISLLQTEIDDLTRQKLNLQKQHLQEEQTVSDLWVKDKNLWNKKINVILCEQNDILNQKQELQKKYLQFQDENQEMYQDIQEKLDSLQLEFRIFSNLRCDHRNQNLNTIIQFQKEYKKIMPQIKKLKNIHNQKETEMLKVLEERKKKYHTLLSQHLQILRNENHLQSLPNEKLYNYCVSEQKKYNRETKNIKNIFLKELQSLEQHIQEQEARYQHIQIKQYKKQETHAHTLSKIKELQTIRHKKQQEIELQQMKILNQIEILDEKINMLVNQVNKIREKQQLLKKKHLAVKTYIPPILDNHLLIQIKKKEVSDYKNQIENMKIRQLQMISIYQSEIKINQQTILELQNSKKRKSKHQKLINLREKMYLQQNRLEKQKHIKDNNKKILQELETLSKIIT